MSSARLTSSRKSKDFSFIIFGLNQAHKMSVTFLEEDVADDGEVVDEYDCENARQNDRAPVPEGKF